ncbi:hypothetical protein H2200_000701 [Cladophialophora chaetospira]|uniref:Fe2OG dioxygenase domain-containing protein n=1 Tax=Cladophialophora chaetospira TaxID=386627 RepID=A0AA38XNY8_9EURO|nr:hypothetical protein H2200_000701 [Cladophialophora chaetospira]
MAAERLGDTPTLDQVKDEIYNVLSEIRGTASFACGGVVHRAQNTGLYLSDHDAQNPGLCLNDHGAIDLPLSKSAAESIISKSKQSPFGKGSETLVDTAIRKSWELDQSQFELCNPKWTLTLNKITNDVYEGLLLDVGLENIDVHLYKLLLYEEGAFFKPHKDSEKVPGMFGTLAICLPCSHDGGELILNFNGETKSIETASTSDSSISYAAWYADVLHEVKPVTSGYRLVLTYNLVRLHISDEGLETPPTPLDDKDDLLVTLTKYSDEFQYSETSFPNFLVYRLEHQYTQASLRAELLKGGDLGRIQCLQQVADELGFELYLATMEKEITKTDDQYANREWQMEHAFDEYDSEDEGGWSEDEEEYDEEEITRSITLQYVVGMNGTRVDDPTERCSRGVDVEEENIVVLGDEDEDEPDDEEHSGHTGNEGCTATFWYRDTVVVIVPPSSRIDFLYKCDSRNVRISAWLKELRQKAETDSLAKSDLANLLLLVLDKKNNYRYSSQEEEYKPILTQEAIASALQCERLDLYDKLVQDAVEPMFSEAFQLLGRALGGKNRAEIEQRIEAAFNVIGTLSQKNKALTSVNTGFFSTLSPEQIVPDEHRVWHQQILVKPAMSATSNQKLSKADGASLADIVAAWTAKAVEEQIIPAILNCGTACKTAFANGLQKIEDSDYKIPEITGKTSLSCESEGLTNLTKTVYAAVWESFELASLPKAQESNTNTAQSGYRQYGTVPRATPVLKPEDHLLDGNDLTMLLNRSRSLDVAKEDVVRSILRHAVDTAGSDACDHTLLPFLKSVCEQKVECLKLDPASGKASEENMSLVTAILLRFVLAWVGTEPTATRSWSQATGAGGCGGAYTRGTSYTSYCSDCSSVNQFLMDPNRQVGQFPVGKKRRDHLDRYYTVQPKGNYSVTTLRGSNPNIWQVTKNPSGAQIAHDNWKKRTALAKEKIIELLRTGRFSPYILESAAAAVAALDIAKLIEIGLQSGPKSATALQPLQPSQGNTRHTAGSKRPAADALDDEGNTKKTKSDPSNSENFVRTKHGFVEIVDLT